MTMYIIMNKRMSYSTLWFVGSCKVAAVMAGDDWAI